MPARARTLTDCTNSSLQQAPRQKGLNDAFSYTITHNKARPFDPSSDRNSSLDPRDGFIFSSSPTIIGAENDIATYTASKLTTGLDATSDDSRVLETCRGTPKVRAFSETLEMGQTLEQPHTLSASCRDYLPVPVSKARPYNSGTTQDRQTSDQRFSERKVQTALAVQTSVGNQKTLDNAAHPIEICLAVGKSRIKTDSEATTNAKRSETARVEVMLDDTQIKQILPSTKEKTIPKVSENESGGIPIPELRQERLAADPRTLPRCEHEDLASHQTIPNPGHEVSVPAARYSSIPTSKVRPFFSPLASTSTLARHGRSPVSKTRPAPAISNGLPSSHDGQPVPVVPAEKEPADWDKPVRVLASGSTSDSNQASGSFIDHKRTKQWLKDVLKYPENRTSRYTRRPYSTERVRNTSPEFQARHSDTVLSSPLPWKFHVRTAVPSEKPSNAFDRLGFKRAVSDLERLLSEALAIASQVVDEPASTDSREPYKQPSISLHSHCRSILSQNETIHAPRLLPCSASADGSGGDYFEPATPTIRSHWETVANTPLSKSQSLLTGAKFRESYQRGQDNAVESNENVTGRSEVDNGSDMSRKKSSNKLDTIPLDHETITDTHTRPETQPSAPDYPLAHGIAQSYNVHNRNLRHTGRRVIRSDYGGHHVHDREAGQVVQPRNRNTDIRPPHMDHGISLHRRSHVSLRGAQGFNLAKSHKRQPVARDWSPIRKRFVASVACISTALIGIILGIYSGLVPSIQYYVIDESHVIVHGNTACFLGLAIPTFFLWPLPLLHGRKPYILSSLVLAMPLLFPQALAVNSQRLTNAVAWRFSLLAARALMGVSLGFASMNFHSILTDLFGASLMSCNPHQEVVDRYDARRHGGGMGVWLGIWTWCWIGSLGVGFLVGACIIDNYNPAFGFYFSIIVIAVVLILNVVCPEVRRSPYRRSVAEVRTGEDISRRVARGEIMMHRVKTGPKWWGQEVYHGIALNLEMLRQPGFAVMAVYSAWIYAQVVLIIVLMGSLLSRFYRRRSTDVGLFVGVVALGALLAIPFQKANLFSRSRQAQLSSNLATLDRKVAWSSHFVRRTIFTLLLPIAGICYAAVSAGPPMHVSVPVMFSGFVGFLSCLAISECNGLVMEAFDCSDLSPAMTGRQKDGSGKIHKRINYSSFPRVTAGFASIHAFAFVLAAGSTALGGYVTRTLGQRLSTGIVAGILLVLTFLLLLILIRFTEVQIVPKSKSEEMDRLVEARRRSTIRRVSMPGDAKAVIEEEEAWRPAMIGNPTSRKRRMNIFELGGMTRWQEIRRKNKLIDAGAHLNREAWDQGIGALSDQLSDFRRDGHVSSRGKKRGHRRLRETGDSSERGEPIEMRDIDHEQSEKAAIQPIWRNRRECALSRTRD
ncbi:hypothetical protein E4U43_004143 [Claviceps pusilla]|uniref:Polyamine transport protein n=1 Tax=Claviceps pusilla TaxID=123648 RepID=A0A9P7T0D4_9HYPO|nr:hypothetical protein E4U43_004143 [Claviceps pusilla]